MCFAFVASFVSDKMGGAVDRESLSTCSCELPIGQLKCELNSNIIPIGKIQTGSFNYHKALLFKVILDVPDHYQSLRLAGNIREGLKSFQF